MSKSGQKSLLLFLEVDKFNIFSCYRKNKKYFIRKHKKLNYSSSNYFSFNNIRNRCNVKIKNVKCLYENSL